MAPPRTVLVRDLIQERLERDLPGCSITVSNLTVQACVSDLPGDVILWPFGLTVRRTQKSPSPLLSASPPLEQVACAAAHPGNAATRVRLENRLMLESFHNSTVTTRTAVPCTVHLTSVRMGCGATTDCLSLPSTKRRRHPCRRITEPRRTFLLASYFHIMPRREHFVVCSLRLLAFR